MKVFENLVLILIVVDNRLAQGDKIDTGKQIFTS